MKRHASAWLGFAAMLASTQASGAELAVREYRSAPRFDWNYSHRYGPAYNWPDGSIATPDRVIMRPGLQPIGLYRGHFPFCRYETATYRAQGGRSPCY